ncbi:MAG: SDR family NAD(P)-dependent oxidoreductase [Acidobacteria bacterium]|nr:SDR family NAD(P)-dependent oxidoreductase [Acidobacteriota bacterium]
MEDKKVWFITGCSTGLGRDLAEVLLEQGYRVVATARKLDSIKDLAERFPELARIAALDVTNRDQIAAAVEKAIEEFGRIDVLVNNAGYGLLGAIEEPSVEQIRAQFDTNVFGAVDVMRAVLPQMREQKSGHVLNMSSVAGFIASGSAGYYAATKFALEALSEALAQEAGDHGIRVTIVEPGPFRTDFGGRSLSGPEGQMPDVYPGTQRFLDYFAEVDRKQAGDPRKAAQVMIDVVESDQPPLRLPLGEMCITRIEAELEKVRADIAPWRAAGLDTAFEE